MVNKEFFKGERVVLERNLLDEEKPETVPTKFMGRITDIGSYRGKPIYSIDGDDGSRYTLEVTKNGKSYLKKYDNSHGSFPWKNEGRHSIERYDPQELRERFPSALEAELVLIRDLAQGSDETKRAGVLTTMRNLTRYLSSEIDRAYGETKRLAVESDEAGRAAALATLRNLNDYLTARATGPNKPAE